jgi:hypothetical protein
MIRFFRSFVPRLPYIILFLGAILRIAGTGSAAIWFDEANMLYRTGIPFLTLFSEHSERSGDLLLEIILRPLMAISHSVWMLRLPSMIAGLISLWLVWKLMQRLNFTYRQQVVTALIVAFLPGLLWIAQDARSYGLLACLFLAAIWFALESQWLGLLAVCGMMIYTHSTGPVCAAAALAIATYLYPWKIRRIIMVVVGIAIAWIPAIIRMLGYWIIQQPWQPHLTLPWLVFSTIQSIWPELWGGWFLLGAFSILVLTLLLLISRIKAHGRIVPLIAWVLPLIGLIIFCLVIKQNVIMYRTLMPMLFPFALWLGWELGCKRISSVILLVAWVLMLEVGLVNWHPADRGGHLDLVAAEIRSQWRTGDTLIYTTTTVGLPFDYYLNELPHAWSNIIHDPIFLNIPSIDRTYQGTGKMTRSWVIIPNETILITPAEQAILDDLVQHQAPVYTINYLQNAPIKVYLVEEP